jgi:hypothetical protein
MNLARFRLIQNFGGYSPADRLLITRARDRIQSVSGFQRGSLTAILNSPPSEVGGLVIAQNIMDYDPVAVDDYYWRTLFQGCRFRAFDSV